MNGRPMLTQRKEHIQSTGISTSGLNNGIYQIVINNDNVIFPSKIIQ